MAETGSGQLASGSVEPMPQAAADIQREIVEIRRRISANLQAAEHRVSVAAGVEDFDEIPPGWRGLVAAGRHMLRNGRGSRAAGHAANGNHPISRRIVVGALMTAALVTAARRRTARSKARAAGTVDGGLASRRS
jgi:hypothetical protein